MNIHTQRNLEAFAQMLELKSCSTQAWLVGRDGFTELYLDVVAPVGAAERVRVSVSLRVAARVAPDALLQVCSHISLRATDGVPVRFFHADQRLVGSACMPAESSAYQWMPVFRFINRRFADYRRGGV